MRVLCLILLMVILPALVPAQENRGSAGGYIPVTSFDPARDAARDIDNALAEAARTKRRVLLDVGGDWCIWCKRLDSLFLKDKDLSGVLSANYVAVKINYSRENKNEEVLARYPKIKGYPHLFVLDAEGTLLHSQETGELEKGKGHDPEKVMAFLKRWAP
jgi:thiol:disulfide interchange protein